MAKLGFIGRMVGGSNDREIGRLEKAIKAIEDRADEYARLSDEELQARLASWKEPTPRYQSGMLSKYARLVSSAAVGAVT